MKTAVCTLYEGNYHLGVGALINSLFSNNFRGDVYVGYRGKLPPWFKLNQCVQHNNWGEVSIMQLSDQTKVFFLKLQTTIHFTNYKPQFLINLTKDLCADYDAIAYFDPDIVVCRKWDYFEDWMQYGVAVVHDIITNDMPITHPLRQRWALIANQCNKKIHHTIHSYINAGFCGIHKQFWSFLYHWQFYVDYGIKHYHSDTSQFMTRERPFPFRSLDQDSLNIALMTYENQISELGAEAMSFVHGVNVMVHAVGKNKPWSKLFIKAFLSGHPPSYADKMFWKYVIKEIKIYHHLHALSMQTLLFILSFLGRFYSKK